MDGIPVESPNPEAGAPKDVLRPEPFKPTGNLYAVSEVDGRFDVVVPGLLDKERELFVGTSRMHFPTREEAEQAVANTREKNQILLDRTSLEKSFTGHSFGISETEDRKFRVMSPALIESKTGYYLGITHKEFDSWNQAKEYYLQQREFEEKFIQNPILEIQTGENERIAFSQWEAFSPRVAPTDQTHEIPMSVQKYLMDKTRMDGSDSSAKTYQETIKEVEWQKKLFSFVSSYLEGPGADTAKELVINRLDALTPKQAAELAARIIIDLTKYKWSDTRGGQDDLSLKLETKADQSTTLQLLQEGLERKNDPNWEGNGVCRNFASSVKAVFEALKANQTKYSQLRNTYCIYEGSSEVFAPQRQDLHTIKFNETGHAWNTFVTVSKEGNANATIADVTWAKQNLDTKKIEGLDHTLIRMEPVIHAVGKDIKKDAPERGEQVKHLLSYYALKIEGIDQIQIDLPPAESLSEQEKSYLRKIALDNFGEKYDLTNVGADELVKIGRAYIIEVKKITQRERERQFFTTRAVELMSRQGVPNELPDPLPKAIEQAYQELATKADISEIVTLYRIYQNYPEFNFHTILKKYLENKQLSDHHAPSIICQNNDLQKIIFDEIKSNPDFEKFLKESANFRIRMREVLPELLGEFSPLTKPEDARELRRLAGNVYILMRFQNLLDPINPSAKQVQEFFERIHKSLRDINPDKYQDIVTGLDDYQLVKQYSLLDSKLRSE